MEKEKWYQPIVKSIGQRIHDLIQTFYHGKYMSARKLTAFALMYGVINMHYKFVTPDNFPTILMIDLVFVAALLGMVQLQSYVDQKLGIKTEDKKKDENEK